MFSPEEEKPWQYFGTSGDGSHRVDQCQKAVDWVVQCILECKDRDVSDDMRPALDYLDQKIQGVGVQRMWEALVIPEPDRRDFYARAALRQITRKLPRYCKK